jgi:hypothetical protein
MKLFPEDPIFVVGEVGFAGKDENGRPYDVLDRKPLGQKLTDLVDRIEQPLVIALDGGWGTGKSHFLKLWTGAHALELGGKAKIIYFDAFANDFLDDPLTSLVSSLVSQAATKTWPEAALNKMKTAAFPLARILSRVGAAIVTGGISELVGPLADVAIAKAGESTEEIIKNFWVEEAGRTAAISQFREALAVLTEPSEVGLPHQKIVFIVDELDRCRPDYALALLEIVKHFFNIQNVHFVLGTSLSSLANSVKCRYGNEVNATKYLQKFISVTMHLPVETIPNKQATLKYFSAVATSYIRSVELKNDSFGQLAQIVISQEVGIRDIQRLLTVFALFPQQYERYYSIYKTMVLGVAFLRVLHPATYVKVRTQRVTLDEIELRLSLEPPKNDGDRQPKHWDWVVWAYALHGKAAWERQVVPPNYVSRVENAFSTFGDQFDWREASEIFAEVFDSFSLPAQ